MEANWLFFEMPKSRHPGGTMLTNGSPAVNVASRRTPQEDAVVVDHGARPRVASGGRALVGGSAALAEVGLPEDRAGGVRRRSSRPPNRIATRKSFENSSHENVAFRLQLPCIT